MDLPSENPKCGGGVMEDIFAVAQPMNTSWSLSFGFIWYDRLHICTRCQYTRFVLFQIALNALKCIT